ncbi:hypothetical protein LINGRAHAP2_LOCUS2569, partial [Linum grandiflorum]
PVDQLPADLIDSADDDNSANPRHETAPRNFVQLLQVNSFKKHTCNLSWSTKYIVVSSLNLTQHPCFEPTRICG